MVFGFKPEYIGKRVTAYIPCKNGELEIREGNISEFLNVGSVEGYEEPMYLVKYDNIEIEHAAQPEWLVFADA